MFVVLVSDSFTRTRPNPDASFVSNGRKYRWVHFYYDYVAFFHRNFFNGHRGLRLDVAISTDCRQIFQQAVRYVNTLHFAVVLYSQEEVSRHLMVRQIVCKCADNLTKLVCIRGRYGPLNTIAFQVIQQRSYFIFYAFVHFSHLSLSYRLCYHAFSIVK